MNPTTDRANPDENDNATREPNPVPDTPTQAIESGDPLVQGRTRGHRVEGRPDAKDKSDAASDKGRSGQ